MQTDKPPLEAADAKLPVPAGGTRQWRHSCSNGKDLEIPTVYLDAWRG
jgi:hypothetical protein